MSSNYKSFVLAGAGNLGKDIAKTFSQAGTPLTVLTRAAGGRLSAEIAGLPHITIKSVDYASKQSMLSALIEAEVVICTFGATDPDAQVALADAAKEAGVKLFVPDEFGVSTPGRNEPVPMLQKKIELQERLKAVNLPYLLVFVGWFYHWIPSVTGYDEYKGETFELVGDGKFANSFTSTTDVARFLHHVLVTKSPKELEWSMFRIEGDTKSTLELFDIIRKHVGRDIPVRHIEDRRQYMADAMQMGPAGFLHMIRTQTDSGAVSVRWDARVQKHLEKNDNDVWPEWKPTPVEEGMKELKW